MGVGRLPVHPVKLALASLGGLLVLAAFLVPPEWAPWGMPLLATPGLALVVLLRIDEHLTRWLRSDARTGGLSRFFRDRARLVVGHLAGLVGAWLALFLYKVHPAAPWETVILVAAIVCGAIAAGCAVSVPLPQAPAPGEPTGVQAIRARSRIHGVRKVVTEAWFLTRYTLPRTSVPLALLTLAWIVLCGLSIAVAWGAVAAFGGDPLSGWENLPFGTKCGLFLGGSGLALGSAAWKLTFLRSVATIRRRGIIHGREIPVHLDRALGTLGIRATVVAGVFLVLALLLFGQVGYFAYGTVLTTGMAPWGALAAGLAVFALLVWLCLLWPFVYVFPLFVARDCGWSLALEVSLRLVLDAPLRAAVLSAAVLLLTLSIVGMPLAAAVQLFSLDGYDQVLAVLLGERKIEEALASLAEHEEKHSERPEALVRAYKFLEEGRFLDGLNAFQIFLHANREHVEALRGECLAKLYVGNGRAARESIERWERLDPGSQEPARLLAELRDGRWDERGDLYLDAQRRNKQPLGRGI